MANWQQNTIIGDIIKERNRQDAKWGVQNHNTFTWLSILMEEVGEASKAALEARSNHMPTQEINLIKYRWELIQAAAVCVAAIESLERNELRDDDKNSILSQDVMRPGDTRESIEKEQRELTEGAQ